MNNWIDYTLRVFENEELKEYQSIAIEIIEDYLQAKI